MQLYNAGIENHPDGSGNLNAIVNGNWGNLNALFNPGQGRTASQTGTALTATADTFTSDDVGATIRFADGTVDVIAAYVSPTQVTMTTSQTVGSQAFELYRTAEDQRDGLFRALYKRPRVGSTQDNRFVYFNNTAKRFDHSQLYVSGSDLIVGTGDLVVLAGNLGLRNNNPTSPLHCAYNSQATGTDNATLVSVTTTHTVSTATGAWYNGIWETKLDHASGVSLTSAGGVNAILGQVVLQDTGHTDNVNCVRATYQNNALGSVTNVCLLRADISKTANANITNLYALFIPSQSWTGTVTNRWGIYVQDAASLNYFAGDVGIGTAPSYRLHVYKIQNSTVTQNLTRIDLWIANSSTSAGAINYGLDAWMTLGHANTADLSNTAEGQTCFRAYGHLAIAGNDTARVNMIQARFDFDYSSNIDDLRLYDTHFTSSASGTLTNFTQIYLESVTFGSTTATNKYAIWQADTALKNQLEGITLLNLPSGELYVESGSLSVGLTTVDTPVELTSGLSSRNLYQTTLVTAHAIQVTHAGKYLIQWSCSFSGAGATDVIEGSVIINSATGTRYLHAHRNSTTAGYIGAMSAQGILSLSAGQEVSMCFQNHTDGDDITISDLHLTVTRIQN